MDKDQVIKIRTKLKAGKNYPLLVYIDNLFTKIDESATLQFTKWDDDNEILYQFSLTDPVMETSPSNLGGTISVFAVTYEMIQAIEAARLDLNSLANTIDSLGCIGAEFKKRILDCYTQVLSPNLINLSRTDINKAMMLADGYKAADDSEDYYAGRYAQSFAETRLMAKHNEYAEKVAAEKKQNN